MIYRAAAVVPYDDRERAVAGLRDQLRLMARAGRTRPDWATLEITGPTEAPGSCDGQVWYEWQASVVAAAGLEDDDLPTSRALPVEPRPDPQ